MLVRLVCYIIDVVVLLMKLSFVEVARRLAKLCEAPFIKVEATKFTEVGFHGRDVDQIIKDLVAVGISDTKRKMKEEESAEV